MRRFYYYSVIGAIGFTSGQGVIVMWPEWSAWTWWGISIALIPLLAAPTIYDYRLGIWKLVSRVAKIGRSHRTPRDLIPLIEGIDMAWSMIRNDVMMLKREDIEGYSISRFFAEEMFGRGSNTVPLYGVSPPLKTPIIINNTHDYSFSDDGTLASNVMDGRNITNLQVRRSDVRRWVKLYLRG